MVGVYLMRFAYGRGFAFVFLQKYRCVAKIRFSADISTDILIDISIDIFIDIFIDILTDIFIDILNDMFIDILIDILTDILTDKEEGGGRKEWIFP